MDLALVGVLNSVVSLHYYLGVLEEQAETRAEALAQLVGETLATKPGLRELEYRPTMRFGTMTALAAGVVATLTKLL